ncbi:YceI family protein [Patescibacteria group bacterium]|jgi:polyisoprenoid-binding protein YceI|nr:YceI family protein [Patescibacteria group bacterium]
MRSLSNIGILITLIALTGFGCAKNEASPAPDTTDDAENFVLLENGAYQANTEESVITWSGKKAIMPAHTGKVSINFADLMIEEYQPVAGSVVINMQSITSDEELVLLEEHLKNDDFFAVETYPTATFTVTNLGTISPPTSNYVATGIMKIRDIEKEISFPIKITQEEDGNIRVTGIIIIDRTDFDIRYNSSSFFENLGDALIENNFTLTLDLLFEKM